MKYVKIVRIEPVDGAKPEKGNFRSGKGYSIAVKYILEDGQVIKTIEVHRLLRDLKNELKCLPREVNNMKASFDDNGDYFGLQYIYNLNKYFLKCALS